MKKLLVTLFFLPALGSVAQTDPQGPNLITLPVTNVTSTAATSGGDILSDGGNFIFTRGIVWDLLPNPDVDTNVGMLPSGQGIGQYDITMTGLDPNTQYYVRAFAQDLAAVWYGGNVSFQTATSSLGEHNDMWMSVGPNPTSGNVTMRWEAQDGMERVTLFDLYGRVIREADVRGSTELKWDLTALAAGNYIIHWGNDQVQGVSRLIKE